MKTLAYALLTFALLRIFSACTPLEAADPRRNTDATIIAAHEAQAVALARQRPDVIRLRGALARATTEAEKSAISSALYAIMAEAAALGRQSGVAAVEAKRRSDEALHRRWDEERRHEEMIQALNNLNLRR